MVELNHDRTRWARLRDQIESSLQHIRDYAVVLIDEQGRIAGWNRGAERMLGYSEADVLGRSAELFFTPEDRRQGVFRRELEKAARTGEAKDERWHLCGDGSRFYGIGTLSVVRDQAGVLLGFAKIFRDLTEQRRAIEQLAESEDRYRTLVTSIKDYAIFMLDTAGRVSYWTPAAERIKGYAPDEIIGKPFATFFTADDRDKKMPERELRAAREQGRVEISGWRVRKGGELFWAEEIATALYDASGQHIGYSKISRDATERREAELERERALRDATEANRLKDEFLSTISHELRTPLNAILGWLQLVRLRNEIPNGLSEALTVVERNARTQGRLIEDLLDASRIVTGKAALTLEQIAFAEPLASALETVRPDAYQKGVELRVQHDVAHDEVSADAGRLQQIIWNLLSNAIKFTPRGGRVTVATTGSEEHIELRITDTGLGIEPAFLPLVFDRFRQAETGHNRQHGGLGLGLSIVKHLVTLHGGQVVIESDGKNRVLSTVAVLVVDDDVDTRRMLDLVLTAQGARVSVAPSTREGLDAARLSKPDVVLADLAMPSEDGFVLLSELRGDPAVKDVPVVAITAHAGSQDRARCMDAGFDSFVSKPIDMNEVIDLIAKLTTERRSQS
jgi:PAS domain S-box-containing protein